MSDDESLTMLEQVANAQAGQELSAEIDDDGITVYYHTIGDERGLTSWNFFKNGVVVVSNTKLGTGLNLRPIQKPKAPDAQTSP